MWADTLTGWKNHHSTFISTCFLPTSSPSAVGRCRSEKGTRVSDRFLVIGRRYRGCEIYTAQYIYLFVFFKFSHGIGRPTPIVCKLPSFKCILPSFIPVPLNS